MPSKPWKFTQIGGTGKTLILNGYAAPFGRPRHGAVVSDGYGQRQAKTYYNGEGPPTRHFFGGAHDTWTLKGRWMDRALNQPAGAANALIRYIKELIRDALPFTIEWGDFFTFTGYLLHILPERESETEIAWTLLVDPDSDDSQAAVAPPTTVGDPGVEFIRMSIEIDKIVDPVDAPADLVFPSDFFDSIGNIISTINSVTASVLAVAEGIDDFEKATAATLNRLLSGIHQLQTALLVFKQTSEDASADAAVLGASAKSQIDWSRIVDGNIAHAENSLVILNKMSTRTQVALLGQAHKSARAQNGDTWEDVSRRQYGSADKADALRQANKSRYGTKPAPGRLLSVPKP